MESVRAVPVIVVDSTLSRNVCGVCTSSISASGCCDSIICRLYMESEHASGYCGQYCRRNVCGDCTGSTGGSRNVCEICTGNTVAIVDSYSEEMYVESVQAVPVTVVDSIVSRNACGV